MKRYRIDRLKEGLIKLLAAFFVRKEQATTLVDCMIEADMRGIHSHGLAVLPAYIDKLQKGAFNLLTTSVIEKSNAVFTTVDANNQIGAISAEECMDIAIKKCAQSGMHSVFCKNANTFGPAFYYAKMAADHKYIGICMSNSPSAMPVWGGNQKMLGTNPFAIAIPAEQNGPVVVDMATSLVAKSKINEIRKKGGRLPEGWAVDENGQPTTDPMEAIRGMVMPMAGHKGSAIAMSIDILAGVLSGAGYLNHVNRFYSEDQVCMNVGQCFIAIDPTAVSDELFYAKMEEYIKEIHQSGSAVLYPGERGNESYRYSCLHGVELSEETVLVLTDIFGKNHIEKALVEHAG